MDVREALEARRTIKRYTDRSVSRSQIEELIRAALTAPNHRMTQPWRFYVLGAQARRGYGEALGRRKAKRVEDPEAAAAIVEKVATQHEQLPAMLAVSVVLVEDPEIREEDYAATLMGVQNLCLRATSMGLGTSIRTGAVMDDPAARAAVGLPDGERIVATVHVGYPESIPDTGARLGLDEVARWVD